MTSMDDHAEAPSVHSQSPKVSTIGTDGQFVEESRSHSAAEAGLRLRQSLGQSLHDPLHWGEVPLRGPGRRSQSVASQSSVGATQDDRSVQGLEVGEVAEEQQLDEEAPVEIDLGQAREEAPATPTADGVSEPGSKDSSVAGRGEGIADDDEEQMGLGLDASPRPPNSNPFELGGEEGEEELGDSSNPFLAAGGGGGSGAGSQRPSMDDDAAAGPLRPSMDGKAAGTGGGWKGDSLDMENVSLEEEEGGAGSAHSARSSESAAGSEGAGGSSSAKAAPGPAEEGAGGARPLENGALLPAASADSPPAAGAAAAAAASAAAAAETSYQSRLMQQLTSEEDDLTVYRPSDFEAAAQAANGVLRNPTVGLAAGAGPSTEAAVPAAAGRAGGGAGVERFEIDTASGPAPPATAADAAHEVQEVNDIWEQTFGGLLYLDGVDALGRPVVVINADAVPHNMRHSALVYCKMHLEPVVNKGHYVLVFTARKAKLPSMWIMGAYRTLPRPYRKNVQLIVLVRPSGFLRAVLAFMRPFVSRKAGRKIKQVESLAEIAEATGGEVTLQHLGARFGAEVASQE